LVVSHPLSESTTKRKVKAIPSQCWELRRHIDKEQTIFQSWFWESICAQALEAHNLRRRCPQWASLQGIQIILCCHIANMTHLLMYL
jgi:hypothetical protein